MKSHVSKCLLICSLVCLSPRVTWCAEEPVDLGSISERHEMIPMRDGVRLSAYLYFPRGDGPWPVLLEQRYAPLQDPATRKAFARMAEGGYVVAAANFRGTHLSEGTYVGY